MRGEAIRDGGGGGTAFYFQGMERGRGSVTGILRGNHVDSLFLVVRPIIHRQVVEFPASSK